jgi:hypothetical protein
MVVFSGANNIAVVGLAKNSGKTVALNAIIKRAQAFGMRIGVASSGRDGEKLDAVTRLPKPRIEVQRGALVATAEKLAMSASASLEPLIKTRHVTVLGRLIIYRVNSPGAIEIASGNKASVVSVSQTHHGRTVDNLHKSRNWQSSHPLCRRIFRHKLRVLVLKAYEFLHETVEFNI